MSDFSGIITKKKKESLEIGEPREQDKLKKKEQKGCFQDAENSVNTSPNPQYVFKSR